MKRQHDREHWPALRAKMTAIFKTRTRGEWCALLEGTDSCVTPVLTMDEAPDHLHMAARNAFDRTGGAPRPNAAPRFREAGRAELDGTHDTGSDADSILRKCGLQTEQIGALREARIVG
jgi:alpha-methylacyl-CoA racemase